MGEANEKCEQCGNVEPTSDRGFCQRCSGYKLAEELARIVKEWGVVRTLETLGDFCDAAADGAPTARASRSFSLAGELLGSAGAHLLDAERSGVSVADAADVLLETTAPTEPPASLPVPASTEPVDIMLATIPPATKDDGEFTLEILKRRGEW